jgi:hypothetical protein
MTRAKRRRERLRIASLTAAGLCGIAALHCGGDDGPQGLDAGSDSSPPSDGSEPDLSVATGGVEASTDTSTDTTTEASPDAIAEIVDVVDGDSPSDATGWIDGPFDAAGDVSDAAADGAVDDGACALSNGTDYFVDPVSGSDTTGTGSGTLADGGASPACALQTITHALEVIPPIAAAGTRIIVLGPASLTDIRSSIDLRSNIVLTTQGGAVTVYMYYARLLGPGAGIRSGAGAPLTLDGNNFFELGVRVVSPSDDTTFLENVTIQHVGSNSPIATVGGTAISVDPSASVTIRQGVTATSNGATVTGNGLYVNGHATIDVAYGQSPTSFSGNGTGIVVYYGGSITVQGSPGGAPGSGTVVANGNVYTGLYFWGQGRNQDAGAVASVVDGIVSYGNGRGIFIGGGASVRLRKSVALGNQADGVWVVQSPAATGDLSQIDLGTTIATGDGGVDYGYNTLQSADGGSPNGGAGICLQVPPDSGTLAAAGNIFSGPRDCTGISPGPVSLGLSINTGSCVPADVALNIRIADAGSLDASKYQADGAVAGNRIELANCTY